MDAAGGGCRAEEATAVPEPRSAAAVTTAPPAETASPHYFAGEKAMGGDIVLPPVRATAAAL